MKVYGWMSHMTPTRIAEHFPGTPRHLVQVRMVVAARSRAEVMRLGAAAGVGRANNPRDYFNLGETGNPESLAAALAEPGVILWQPLDHRSRSEWARA